MYTILKLAHIASVCTSIALFTWRWQRTLSEVALPYRPWLQILPHINDTLLLALAFGMMTLSGQYPLVHSWLTAKVLGLVGYILSGMLALKAKQRSVRFGAGVGALITAAYIVSVAFTKDPRGILINYLGD